MTILITICATCFVLGIIYLIVSEKETGDIGDVFMPVMVSWGIAIITFLLIMGVRLGEIL